MIERLLATLLAALPVVPDGPAKPAVRMEAEGDIVLRPLAARLPGPGEGLAVWLRPGADPAPMALALEERGAEIVALSLRPDGSRIVVTLPGPGAFGSALAVLARPEVAGWAPWAVAVPLNDDSIWVGQSYDAAGKSTPIFDRGITGTGEVVAVFDTGLDPDMCYFVFGPGQWSPAQALIPPDIGVVETTRKTWANYVQPGAIAYDPPFGHGTAVAGCVLGDDWATPSTPVAAGHDAADGNAPNARLIALDGGAGGALSGIVGDLTPAFLQSYLAGARIQNHSWGSPGLNAYSPDSADIDRFTWRHEDMLFVNANGNSGAAPDDGSVIAPAVAKSALSVGATTNGSAGARDLTSFTSRGPTFDGRLKPDVVAPGESVRTAQATGTQGDDNCAYFALSGTSFAAPTASGWAALARQYFRDGFLPSGVATVADAAAPSAALVKAAMIAAAVPAGGNDPRTGGPIDPPPSFNQGWGRPLLDDALYFTGDPRQTTVLDLGNSRGLAAGAAARFGLDVVGPVEPLEVVLAWTDPPADPAVARALVNDLDLVVTDPLGQSLLGNVWSNGESAPGGSPDDRNPVEAVRVAAPAAGRWTIEVRAPAVLGRPGLDGGERQGFALVATYPSCGGPSAAPAGLTAQDRATSIDLSWNPVPGALGYLVYRADGLASPGPADHRLLTPAPIAATAFSDGDVQCGTDYSYLVRAWDGCSLGAASAARALARSRGSCDLRPDFAGLADARPTGICGEVRVEWTAATSRCPCSTGVVYNVWASSAGPVDPGVTPPVLTCVGGTSAVVSLPPGAGLTWLLVRAEDRVPGGSGRCGGVEDGNLRQLVSVPLSPTRVVRLADNLDAGRGNWSRRSLSGGNAWDILDEPYASSATKALVGLDLWFASDSVAELLPPVVPGPDTALGFLHTYELEGRFDGGVVEYSTDGGSAWIDAGPRIVQVRYDDWLMTGPSSRTLRPGWTGGALGAMRESLVWLGDLAGQTVRLRWRSLSDSSGRRERWAIDDIAVFDRDCAAPGALVAALASDAPACEGEAVAFDAGASYGGAPPYAFTWDFGDGTPAAAGGATATHVYPGSGSWTATVTVRDSLGRQDSATFPVVVASDLAAPDLGNELRIVKQAANFRLAWSEPPGRWPATEVGRATARDLSDLTPLARIPWDEPRTFDAGAMAAAPPFALYRLRLFSECRGTAGAW